MDEFLKKQNFLVIAPHSDDEMIGCGGTIAKIKDVGGKVYVIVVSVGDLRHYAKDKKIVKKEVRKKELESALKFLKVDDVDISKYLQIKIKAFSYHKSQIVEFPHPNSIENLINLANMRGVEAGVEAAEAFKCYGCII